jgi:hypothetical protein
MNNQTQEALKMAIKALLTGHHHTDLCNEALNACKEALEQPAKEPVAWIKQWENMFGKHKDIVFIKTDEYSPLYTHPHQWQGLTDDEILKASSYIDMLGNIDDDDVIKFACAIEAKLKEKNHG